MVRSKKKKVTTIKKFNNDLLFNHPAVWAFGILIFFAIMVSVISWNPSNIASFFTVAKVVLWTFIGLSLYGGIKEVTDKNYDFKYMAVGLFGLSLLFLSMVKIFSGMFMIGLSLLIALIAVVISIIALIRSIKNKESISNILFASFLVIVSVLLSYILSVVMVLVDSIPSSNFTGW